MPSSSTTSNSKNALITALVASVLVILTSSVASAHYVLTSPLTRGFSDDDEPTGPCGGFNTTVNPVAFPLKSNVSISAFHSKANVSVSIQLTGASSFTLIKTFATDFGTVNTCSNLPPWNSSFPIDLTAVSGAKSGDKAVIQTIFDGPDGALYQCADVVLGDATGLAARTDDGLATIPDLRPTDLCTVANIKDLCPAVVCPANGTATASATGSAKATSSSASTASASPSNIKSGATAAVAAAHPAAVAAVALIALAVATMGL